MKPNLVAMKPGPRGDMITDVQFRTQLGKLQEELKNKDLLIQNMQSVLRQGEQAFRRTQELANNAAIHLAALLLEKHGGRVWIAPEKLEEVSLAMQKGEFGGFDFEDVGPDATGPRRHKMVYMTMAESKAIQQDRLAMARHSPPEAVAAEPDAPPAVCAHPFHQSAKSPYDVCPKCKLAFPRVSS